MLQPGVPARLSTAAPVCCHQRPLQVQRCTLLSIKTGGCPENCGYCSQSSHWSKETGTKAEKLMGLDEVYEVGSSRFLATTTEGQHPSPPA